MASPGLKRDIIQYFMARFCFVEFPSTCFVEMKSWVSCRVSFVQHSSSKQFFNPHLTASPSLVEQHSVYVLGQVDKKKLEQIEECIV